MADLVRILIRVSASFHVSLERKKSRLYQTHTNSDQKLICEVLNRAVDYSMRVYAVRRNLRLPATN